VHFLAAGLFFLLLLFTALILHPGNRSQVSSDFLKVRQRLSLCLEKLQSAGVAPVLPLQALQFSSFR